MGRACRRPLPSGVAAGRGWLLGWWILRSAARAIRTRASGKPGGGCFLNDQARRTIPSSAPAHIFAVAALAPCTRRTSAWARSSALVIAASVSAARSARRPCASALSAAGARHGSTASARARFVRLWSDSMRAGVSNADHGGHASFEGLAAESSRAAATTSRRGSPRCCAAVRGGIVSTRARASAEPCEDLGDLLLGRAPLRAEELEGAARVRRDLRLRAPRADRGRRVQELDRRRVDGLARGSRADG